MKLISTRGGNRKELADSNRFFYIRASVTVEASWVVGICILIIGSLLLTGFDVFEDSRNFVENVQAAEYDGIDLFRRGEAAKGLIEMVKEGF